MSTELLDQRSPEWLAARCGSLGASSVHEAIARTKTGWGASRANLLARLVVERLTGAPQEGFTNAAMQHGIDTEPEARAAYSFLADVDVHEVGLVRHPTINGTHASPDGLIEAARPGLIEIKCPQPAAHLALLSGELTPSKYVTQIQWQLACTGRMWADFVSYSPAFPESMRLFVQRIERNDRAIAELEAQVREFLAELDAKLAALTSRYGTPVREAA
jgi:putative phage-type endonuclease